MMTLGNASHPLSWWIVAGTGILAALASLTLALLSAASFMYADTGFDLVKQHFGEPQSVFPVFAVAAFFGIAAIIAAVVCIYCRVLAQTVLSLKDANLAQSFKILAWLMLAMHLALFPMGYAALDVETAFKGPTSEVVMAYEIIAFLALLTMFAFAQAAANDASSRRNREGEV